MRCAGRVTRSSSDDGFPHDGSSNHRTALSGPTARNPRPFVPDRRRRGRGCVRPRTSSSPSRPELAERSREGLRDRAQRGGEFGLRHAQVDDESLGWVACPRPASAGRRSGRPVRGRPGRVSWPRRQRDDPVRQVGDHRAGHFRLGVDEFEERLSTRTRPPPCSRSASIQAGYLPPASAATTAMGSSWTGGLEEEPASVGGQVVDGDAAGEDDAAGRGGCTLVDDDLAGGERRVAWPRLPACAIPFSLARRRRGRGRSAWTIPPSVRRSRLDTAAPRLNSYQTSQDSRELLTSVKEGRLREPR